MLMNYGEIHCIYGSETQFCPDVYRLQVDLSMPHNSSQNPIGLFAKNGQADSKIQMEMQMSWHSRSFFEKEEQSWEIYIIWL